MEKGKKKKGKFSIVNYFLYAELYVYIYFKEKYYITTVIPKKTEQLPKWRRPGSCSNFTIKKGRVQSNGVTAVRRFGRSMVCLHFQIRIPIFYYSVPFYIYIIFIKLIN